MKLRDIAAASRIAGGGGGHSGPVSWNDLTDKPFYHDIVENVHISHTDFEYNPSQGRIFFMADLSNVEALIEHCLNKFGMVAVPDVWYTVIWENSATGERIEQRVSLSRRMTFVDEEGLPVIDYNRRYRIEGPVSAEELTPYWSMRLCTIEESIKTIDEKFLPTNSGGVSSWNDLTDKPFYEETKDVTLLENFTSADYEANDQYAPYIDLKAGTCTIVWNERTFENVTVQMDSYGGYVYISEDDWYIEMWAGGINEVTYLYSSDEQFTVSIYQTQKTIKGIDEKYLPFHTTESILGDVYLEGIFETIEDTLEDDPYNVIYSYATPTELSYLYVPMDGTMFRVTIDDVIYDLSYRQVYSSSGYFGARDLFTAQEYPFSIWTGGYGDLFTRISFTTPGPHSVIINEFLVEPTIVPIEDKYIPDNIIRREELDERVVQPDWNMNYDEPSHIKNRTHYQEDRVLGNTLIAEGQLTFNSGTVQVQDVYGQTYYRCTAKEMFGTQGNPEFAFEDLGREYTYSVVIDEVEYPNLRPQYDGNDVYIGNGGLMGIKTCTDANLLSLPFVVSYSNSMKKFYVFTLSRKYTTMKIYKQKRRTYKLNDIYMPDGLVYKHALPSSLDPTSLTIKKESFTDALDLLNWLEDNLRGGVIEMSLYSSSIKKPLRYNSCQILTGTNDIITHVKFNNTTSSVDAESGNIIFSTFNCVMDNMGFTLNESAIETVLKGSTIETNQVDMINHTYAEHVNTYTFTIYYIAAY